MIGLKFKSEHTPFSAEWQLDKAEYHKKKRDAYDLVVQQGIIEDDIDENEAMRGTLLHQNLYVLHAIEYVRLLLESKNNVHS